MTYRGHKEKGNDRSSRLLNKFSLSAPWKCIENSMENMFTDVRVQRVKGGVVVQLLRY